MNNRLHKLTDSPESQLNYFSRITGRPTRTKPPRGSPLLSETPNSLRITSRSPSPQPTPHQRSHSPSRASSIDSHEHTQILIVDSPSAQILIVDQEEEEEEESIAMEEEPGEQDQSETIDFETPDKPFQPQKSVRKESPIFILEQDQKLIWIQKDEYYNDKDPTAFSSIKIEEEEEEEEGEAEQYEETQEHNYEAYPLLPEIQELSLIEEEDIEESFHLTTSRIPVSPHTQPLLKLHRIENRLIELEQHYWITQDNSKPSPPKQQSTPQPKVQQPYSNEEAPLESRFQFSQSQSCSSRLIDEEYIRSALATPERQPFNQSILQASRLKGDMSNRKLNSVEEMHSLIHNESFLVQQKLKQQRGTINILKNLISLRLKLPSPLKLESHPFSLDQQMLINQHLIRTLARGKQVNQ